MTSWRTVIALALILAASPCDAAMQPALPPVPHDDQTAIVERYLNAIENARYGAAYALLNSAAQKYYRTPENFGSVFTADAYRITAFTLLGARGDDRAGRVFFARETARFRDHAHDVDLTVTATVPIGVIAERGGWSIKDPGHPWSAFATRASGESAGVRATVKKMSFFERRIEAVISIANTGTSFVTVLPYGRSLLRDSAARRYRPIETRNWSLTDKTFFEGLRLAPDAQYTGVIAFACEPLRDSPRTFTLTIAPILADGADAPFAIDISSIAADNAPAGAQR